MRNSGMTHVWVSLEEPWEAYQECRLVVPEWNSLRQPRNSKDSGSRHGEGGRVHALAAGAWMETSPEREHRELTPRNGWRNKRYWWRAQVPAGPHVGPDPRSSLLLQRTLATSTHFHFTARERAAGCWPEVLPGTCGYRAPITRNSLVHNVNHFEMEKTKSVLIRTRVRFS